MADNQQQIDHYDFINAPQFVDFSDLAAQDDPDADKFFETHREEDDFMIPLDINTISPTVQLLYDGNENENEHYSNEANKAAMAAGLEDVKIEYYASPTANVVLSQPSSANTKKSLNSIYGTPLGGSSALSSQTSFYTPTAGSGSEDKENRTPTSLPSKHHGSLIKMGKSDLMNSNFGSQDKGQRTSVLIDQAQRLLDDSIKGSGSGAAQSLMSRLDQLSIVSSDEEEGEVHNHKSYSPPAELFPSACYASAENVNNANVMSESTFNTFKEDKLAFLGLPTNSSTGAAASTMTPGEALDNSASSYNGDIDVTMIGNASNDVRKLLDEFASNNHDSSDDDGENGCGTGGGMELHSPVDKILKILEAQLTLEENNLDDENPRCSIVVAPRIGEQVHWNSNDETSGASAISNNHFQHYSASLQQQSAFTAEAANTFGYNGGKELNVSYFVEGHANGDSFEGSGETTLEYISLSEAGDGGDGMTYKNRRASSVGDLVRAIEVEPKTRQFETYGYIPRMGITIPKTPDVATERKSVPRTERSEVFNQNKNSCYFEIEAPTPETKVVRRVSSCSDLVSLQQKAKQNFRSGVPRPAKVPQKKALTIPKTPEALKRTQKSHAARNDAESSAGSTSSKIGLPSMRGGPVVSKPAGPSVAERLAAAKSRQPVKANHYVSMAEAMIKYQKNTPDRFRSLPRGRSVPEKRATSCDSRKRGAPSPARSPDYAAATTSSSSRSRADSFSVERKESNFGKNSGPVLPKKVELKPTIPRPFNLSCGQRARTVPKDEDVVDFKFKARPAPSKGQHDNAPLLKSRPQVKVTMPMSPHFASDDRLKERHQKRAQTKSPEPKSVKTTTVTHHQNRPSRLPTAASSSIRAAATHHHHPEEHKTTVAQPFSSSFDARQKEILRRKEEKIKLELGEDKKSREFHANPVPKFSSAKLPKKKPVEVTHVEPFRLKSDERGAHYQEALKKKLEEEEQRLRELAQFHAQPADVVHKPPFEPERPTRIIEGPLDFHLATEKRAIEREQFDEQLREKEREEEERKREEQETLQELQKQEDLERRRQLVHKAQPFRAPKPFQLKSSGKALTIPQSPAFSAMPSERRVNRPYSPNTSNASNH